MGNFPSVPGSHLNNTFPYPFGNIVAPRLLRMSSRAPRGIYILFVFFFFSNTSLDSHCRLCYVPSSLIVLGRLHASGPACPFFSLHSDLIPGSQCTAIGQRRPARSTGSRPTARLRACHGRICPHRFRRYW